MRTYVCTLLLLAACSQTVNPCPKGNHINKKLERCVPNLLGGEEDAEVVLEVDDAAVVAEPEPGADEPVEAEDAAIDDAEMDAATTLDADIHDADVEGGADAAEDAAVSTPDADAALCSESDVSAWRAGHLTGDLVSATLGCFATCNKETACTLQCVADRAKMDGCKECASLQFACVVDFCGAACTVAKTDQECLACQCELGCTKRFEECAGRTLNLCSPELFGVAATDADPPLATPVLYRQKSATGGLNSSRLESGSPWPPAWNHQFARYFQHLVSFPLNGREYMLHTKSDCRGGPCTANISALLSDASFARPQYQSAWTPGFDELDVFGAQGAMYLSRYKSGKAPAEVEPAGTLWIDRITLSEGVISLVPVLRSSLRPSEMQTYDTIEPFQIGGQTHLLAHQASSGRVELLAFVNETLEVVPSEITWTIGWDVLETFKVAERWLLLAYNSGRVAASTETPGAVRVFELMGTQEGVGLSSQLYSGLWTAGATHAVGIRGTTSSSVVMHHALTGLSEQHALAQDGDPWASFGQVAGAQSVGLNPPWDVFEGARQGKW